MKIAIRMLYLKNIDFTAIVKLFICSDFKTYSDLKLLNFEYLVIILEISANLTKTNQMRTIELILMS